MMGSGSTVDDDVRMALGAAIGTSLVHFVTSLHEASSHRLGGSILMGIVAAVTVLAFSRLV